MDRKSDEEELRELEARGEALLAKATQVAQQGERLKERRGIRLAGLLEDRSLGLPRVWAQTVAIGVVFAAIGALLLGIFAVPGSALSWLLAPAAALVLLCVAAAYWAFWTYPKAQKRWLHHLPFKFDVQAYMAVLGERHYGRRLLVTVTFVNDVDDSLRQRLPLVVAGALRGASGQMVNARTLVISGKPVRTWFLPGKKSALSSTQPIHDNSNLHGQFRQCVLRCLGPISKSAPIQKVVVRGPQASV